VTGHVHKYGSKYLRCEMYKTKEQITAYLLSQFALQTIANAKYIQSILLWAQHILICPTVQ
jgi:hypothetical protein